jgi:hypothetical protein
VLAAKAAWILRRWKAPTGAEDVEQEMAVAVWQKFAEFDPSRGVSIGRFLLYGAGVVGKAEAHRARQCNKHGTRDKNPSRYAVPFSSMRGVDEGGFDPADMVVAEPIQERVAEVRAILARCRTTFDRSILEALVATGGSVREVAGKLFAGIDGPIATRMINQALINIGCTVSDIERMAA